MFDQKKVKDLVLVSLVADAYSLGSHWVYDEKQLADANIDWNNLNAPLAIWHKGKAVGEFTHYGDQTYWLYDFLSDKEDFDDSQFLSFWLEKMKNYEGYIDGATRNTIENVHNGVIPSGSESSDLSVVGRIVPLLKVSKSKEEFILNSEKLTKLTHNSAKSVIASRFFAKLFWAALEGRDIEETILSLKDDCDSTIQGFITKAIETKKHDTFEVIRSFGPACDVSEGFGGILHLLLKYDNIKDMLICNAQAGGDSSARAMIASAILMANKSMTQVPSNWLAIKVKID